MTHSNVFVTSRVRAAPPALDLLQSVLAVIQRASKELEHDVEPNDRALRDFLKSLRLAAYSISFKFREMRAAGLEAELARYATVILDAVETRVSEGVLEWALYKKDACKSYKTYSYPKSHALGYLVDNNPIDQPFSDVFWFPDSSARDDLVRSLTATLDELHARYPDPSESFVQPARKRRRDPQWDISDSACKIFRAMSCCRQGPNKGCIIESSQTCLALATYMNLSESQGHFFDVLFAPVTETTLSVEMRIHTHNPAPDYARSAVPKVTFADEGGKATSTAEWWAKKPRQVSHFCKLLGPSKKHVNATNRVNVVLDANNDIWRHLPTHNRFLDQPDLSRSISLTTILDSGKRDLNGMAKLMLAVILSYSLLYLYGGPWLIARNAAGLNRDAIFFFEKGGKILLRPFLRSDLRGGDEGSSNDGDESDDEDDCCHPYPIILGLGVTLLEIHLGDTLESLSGRNEPLVSADDKWAIACEVFERWKTSIPGDNYRDAIKSCLDIRFGADDDDEAQEDIEQMRSLIFKRIVGPLQDELEYGYGTFIKFDELDEQAASMDLSSGLSTMEAVVESLSPYKHYTRITKSTRIQFSSPEMRKVEPEKAMVTAAHIIPNPPRNIVSVIDSYKAADTGELYTLFGDPNTSSYVSPQGRSLTDIWTEKFQNLKELCPLQELEPGDSRRVRVAVIDTGIDMTHVDIQAAVANGRVIKVCDWVDGQEGIEDDMVGDSFGHGTHVASVILDMAPNVDLYIARVAKGRELSHSQAENVAKAIRTASSHWGCAIINLSLGFECGIQCIEDELKSATEAGVLVFAAASNDGYNAGLAYPAWNSRVFCIYSLNEYGLPSCFNPSPDEQSGCGGGVDGLSIVGEHVRGAWPSQLSPGGVNHHTRTMSGTSFATPVAAALAACVLGFARLKFEPGRLENSFLNLAGYDGMRSVLFKMTTKKERGYRCLNPHRFFDRAEQEILADIWRALNPRK